MKTFYCDSMCEIRKCVLEKGLVTCADCPELECCQMVGAVLANSPNAWENLRGIDPA